MLISVRHRSKKKFREVLWSSGFNSESCSQISREEDPILCLVRSFMPATISIQIIPNNLIFGGRVQNCSCNYRLRNFARLNSDRYSRSRNTCTTYSWWTEITSL